MSKKKTFIDQAMAIHLPNYDVLPGFKVILIALAWQADRTENLVTMPIAELRKLAGCSKTKCTEGTEALKHAGIIGILHGKGAAPNTYILRIPKPGSPKPGMSLSRLFGPEVE